jgi:hypothetical protein
MVIFSIQSILSLGGLGVVTSASMLSLVCYVVYQRFLHPLASYPGPLAASLTNIWKSYYVYNLVLHEKLVELHEQHGAVVRIGPNDLHFWTSEAVAPIYKAGKAMGKTEFYNAFTTFNPNLFGTTDEAVCLDFLIHFAQAANLSSAESFLAPSPSQPRFLASIDRENGTNYRQPDGYSHRASKGFCEDRGGLRSEASHRVFRPRHPWRRCLWPIV